MIPIETKKHNIESESQRGVIMHKLMAEYGVVYH